MDHLPGTPCYIKLYHRYLLICGAWHLYQDGVIELIVLRERTQTS